MWNTLRPMCGPLRHLGPARNELKKWIMIRNVGHEVVISGFAGAPHPVSRRPGLIEAINQQISNKPFGVLQILTGGHTYERWGAQGLCLLSLPLAPVDGHVPVESSLPVESSHLRLSTPRPRWLEMAGDRLEIGWSGGAQWVGAMVGGGVIDGCLAGRWSSHWMGRVRIGPNGQGSTSNCRHPDRYGAGVESS